MSAPGRLLPIVLDDELALAAGAPKRPHDQPNQAVSHSTDESLVRPLNARDFFLHRQPVLKGTYRYIQRQSVGYKSPMLVHDHGSQTVRSYLNYQVAKINAFPETSDKKFRTRLQIRAHKSKNLGIAD
jgi:hypothetical protein